MDERERGTFPNQTALTGIIRRAAAFSLALQAIHDESEQSFGTSLTIATGFDAPQEAHQEQYILRINPFANTACRSACLKQQINRTYHRPIRPPINLVVRLCMKDVSQPVFDPTVARKPLEPQAQSLQRRMLSD
jgi:hypothetical protein